MSTKRWMPLALLLTACGSEQGPTIAVPGRGVEENEVTRYTASCNGGDAKGCFNLGRSFDRGLGVAKDEARAAALYTRACDGGDIPGCFNLGVDFAEGVGVAKDEARAAALYTRACDGGDIQSCFNLGLLFGAGTGVAKDEARAAALFTKACAGGLAKGCSSLGDAAAQGRPAVGESQPPTALVQAAPYRFSESLPSSPYAEARAKFQTHLLRHGSAPQRYGPISPPPGAREVPYSSGKLNLKAWVSAPPPAGTRLPAVLFLHGGFAFGEDDWEMTRPYRDAGFVVLVPMLRGENGLPGDYSMFFDELDDVLAAADALAGLPYVRADRLYVAGHSVGGTLAILAAMSSRRFRAAASFSGSPDQIRWSAGVGTDVVPFDPSDAGELRMRSPLEYVTSFRCPTRLYHGVSERFFAAPTARLAELAQRKGLDVRVVPIFGDHLSHVAEAMNRSIDFFRQKE